MGRLRDGFRCWLSPPGGEIDIDCEPAACARFAIVLKTSRREAPA